MNRQPILYVAIAAPLLEEACCWQARLPEGKPFPRSKTGAYGFQPTEAGELLFCTGPQVSVERVRQEVEERGGELLTPLPVLVSRRSPDEAELAERNPGSAPAERHDRWGDEGTSTFCCLKHFRQRNS